MFDLRNVKFKNVISYPDIKIRGECTTFICGESGSGKSTLLKLLNGVISPTEGMITYLGNNIEDYDPITLRREILLVSQSVYLFEVSIKENFNKYYAYRDLDFISEDDMKRYLDICSVHLSLDSMCNVLSGGERHRIFIAINLSFQSNVLMMDEPTSALDNKNANTLIENIKSYCVDNRKTLIIITHDKGIADKYADNIIMLSGGNNSE